MVNLFECLVMYCSPFYYHLDNDNNSRVLQRKMYVVEVRVKKKRKNVNKMPWNNLT